jgi:hypothetical protein
VPRVAATLARLRQREHFTTDDDLVFVNTVGRPLGDDKLHRRFKTAIRDAGLRELRFHDLRHSFGTMAVRALRPDVDGPRAHRDDAPVRPLRAPGGRRPAARRADRRGRAVGDRRPARRLTFGQTLGRPNVASDARNNETPVFIGGFLDAGGGTRTPDTRINIPRDFGLTIGHLGPVGHAFGHIRIRGCTALHVSASPCLREHPGAGSAIGDVEVDEAATGERLRHVERLVLIRACNLGGSVDDPAVDKHGDGSRAASARRRRAGRRSTRGGPPAWAIGPRGGGGAAGRRFRRAQECLAATIAPPRRPVDSRP